MVLTSMRESQSLESVNPSRPGLFSRSPGPIRGSEAWMPKIKVYQNMIESKFCMSHCSHKVMPDAKFETDSFCSFGGITSQNFPLQKGTSHRIHIFTPRKWI